MTSRITSLTSSNAFSGYRFEHRTNALDHLTRPIARVGDAALSARTSARPGGCFASQRNPALQPNAIVASGCLISCAIEAAICPAAVKLVTRASSACISRNLSCARLLSVISIIVPINISDLDSGARATEIWPQTTMPSLRRYCFMAA